VHSYRGDEEGIPFGLSNSATLAETLSQGTAKVCLAEIWAIRPQVDNGKEVAVGLVFITGEEQ
jgi:hypothetical protein